MTVFAQIAEAMELLGLETPPSERELRRAYRMAARKHPPETDPDGFVRVRRAYETLNNPCQAARERLESKRPWTVLPELPTDEPASLAPLAVAVLRDAVRQLDLSSLDPATGRRRSLPKKRAAAGKRSAGRRGAGGKRAESSQHQPTQARRGESPRPAPAKEGS